jgi:hypothetical protein
MSAGLFLERSHTEIGIAAVADFAAGDVFSDVVNMRNYGRVVFITHWGVGTTGVVKLTVEAADDAAASNVTAVPFYYRINKAGVFGAVTRATAADGVSNEAASNQVIVVEVLAEDLGAAGYQYVRLNVDETTDNPLLGGVLIMQLDPKWTPETANTSLT